MSEANLTCDNIWLGKKKNTIKENTVNNDICFYIGWRNEVLIPDRSSHNSHWAVSCALKLLSQSYASLW